MYKNNIGVYIGKNAENQEKRVLILGESHHGREEEESSFSTIGVMENLKRVPMKRSYRFFHKIAKSCKIEIDHNDKDINEEFELFWDNVYFGNYVEKLCGVGDNKAKKLIADNFETYNNNLFTFINENNINVVLVFSRLTFNNLPSLTSKEERCDNLDDGTLKVGKRRCRDYISHCKYLANTEHRGIYSTTVKLNADVDFYGFRHPSCRGGYEIENYKPYIKELNLFG